MSACKRRITVAEAGQRGGMTTLKNRGPAFFKSIGRKGEIQQAIAKEPHNAYGISSQITWDIGLTWKQFPALQKRFAVMETIAHLEGMRWEGTVRRIVKGNSILYGLGELTK